MATPEYLHEYVSASVEMYPITSGTVWELDITLANRGRATEFFKVQFVQAGDEEESFLTSDFSVAPGRTGGYGLGAETDPNVVAWEQWWARIFTTSLNLVPTMRFHVEGNPDPPVPEFFFGPGDFAVFPWLEWPPAVGIDTTTSGTA
jgi:hypothetical protein